MLHRYLVASMPCCLVAFFIAACMKEAPVMGIPKKFPWITIAELKAYYNGADVSLDEEHTEGASRINGIVISDVANKNIPEGIVVIQNDTSGICLALDAATAAGYNLGDSLEIIFSQATLANYKGSLRITGLTPDNIKKVGTNKPVTVSLINLKVLSDNFSRYEATLVQIAGADVTPQPAPGVTYKGDKGLYDGSVPDGTVKLHTEPNASIANVQAVANATFTGIPLWYNPSGNTTEGATKQLSVRNAGDIVDNSLPLQTDIVITGIMSDPKGADGPYNGQMSGTLRHAGGYEYIQLLATRDIDFSQTPYSVVTVNNGTATVNGWAAGGVLSYKFNLRSGFAAKGTFFYVGGPSKVIAGYDASQGKSTDISSANWIRTINYNVNNGAVITGDGFGNSNAGFLGNSSPADGVAVFKDTTITAASVPIDAVFYGTTVGTAYSGGNGYRIPANDHYNPINPTTGEAQPFFGQGTNTYVFAQPLSDVSSFQKLGGVLTANAWLNPRQTTLVTLPLTAKLSDIETAVGVTYFRK